jgi:aspartyl-tRNA synthetase
MSFVTQDDVFAVVERVLHGTFTEFGGDKKISPLPFVRIPFEDAMLKYGSDKPDLRNPLEIKDISAFFNDGSFRAFAGKTIRALTAPAVSSKSRSFFDKLEARAKELGAAGLAWLTVEDGGTLKGPIAKFIAPEKQSEFSTLCGAKTGDGIFIVAHEDRFFGSKVLGVLRNELGDELDLLEKDCFKFCWIVDFPMYELDKATGKLDFSHNPFSMPQGELDALLNQDPLTIKAYQYDIVCNGYELSSGAIRNHRPEIMYKAFELVGYSKEEVETRFGGMLTALKFGAPPHGGTAPGIDRIVMLIADEKNLREVVAFPMNQKAQDLLMGAPSDVRPQQLKELHIKLDLPPEKRTD